MQHQFMVKNVISSMKNLALNTVSIAVIFAVLFIFVLYISGIEHAKQELNAGDIIGILLMISWLIIAVYGLVWVHWTSESEDIESVRQKQAAIEEQREKTHIMNGQYNAKDDIFILHKRA